MKPSRAATLIITGIVLLVAAVMLWCFYLGIHEMETL